MFTKLIEDTDSYKISHYKQYPPETTNVYSYMESRGGDYEDVVFFGLQYVLNTLLDKDYDEFVIGDYESYYKDHGLALNVDSWRRLLKKRYLPLKICAVDEGSINRPHDVLMTIENTDPEYFWLPGWVETRLMRLWYPITVASRSYAAKKILAKTLMETQGSLDGLEFMLHDFGSRGASSAESAAIGGAAHLVNFKGTDTTSALFLLKRYYGERVAGFSIPAAEHSTITSWGRENEAHAYSNMLRQFNDSPIMAVVSDSYNIYDAIENLWGGTLKDEVLSYQGKLVIRPDSGNPKEMVIDCLKLLAGKFGFTTNALGFKKLNNVGLIQGDGMTLTSLEEVILAVKEEGFCLSNLAFGMGGHLLQDMTRDTMKFAIKCSSIIVNGEERDVYKDPVSDPGKLSKRGRFNHLKVVYENGKMLNEQTLFDIRGRAKL